MKELTKEYKELLTQFSIKEFDMIPVTDEHFRMIEEEIYTQDWRNSLTQEQINSI